MSRSRDISNFLGKTELNNSQNEKLLLSTEAGLDSASVISLSQSTALSVYSSVDSLPASGLTAGQQAFVQGNSRLYMSNGSGWYNVALINLTPTMSLDPSGTIQLNAETLTSTVTIIAQDSDNPDAILSYSIESDGNMLATGVTVSQDSSVFTITGLSADSGGVAGNFTLTFKTTDQINTASEALAFTLSFGNIIDSSAETMLLMKATGNNATNAAITYQNSSDISTGFTEAGTPVASTFSPYRSGGYSTYFDGTGDFLSFAETVDNNFTFGTGDFTFECWYYPVAIPASGNEYFIAFGQGNANDHEGFLLGVNANGKIYGYIGSGSSWTSLTSGTATISANSWHHLAMARSGTSLKIFVDGVEDQSVTNSTNIPNANNLCQVGGRVDTNGSSQQYVTGYLRDVRLLKGSAQYTAAFTPPTEALTAITNTVLLACHAPYLVDGSSTGHTLTINGTPKTVPFGPYDQEPWTANDHGGSVYFDGTGDYLTTAASTDYDLSGDVTVECWVRLDASASGNQTFWSLSEGNSDGYTIGYLRENVTPDQMAISTVGVAGAYAQGNMDHKEVWYHMAWVKQGTPSGDDEETRMYFNGKRIYNANGTSLWNAPTTPTLTIGTNYQSTPSPTYGHIADFHWTNSAKYTGSSYTVPTSPVSADGNTVLRMNNKSDANIYDAAAANTLKLNSGAQSSTTQRKFSTSSSILINGTDDKVTIENFGIRGDMTFEGWFMQTTQTGVSYRTLLEASTYTGSTPFGLFTYNTQVQLWGLQNGVQITGTFSQNTWHHVAVVRNSGTWTLYIDGTSQGTNTNNGTYNFADTTDWNLGAQGSNASDFIGYLQDWRFSNRAVYTTNFTPPTTEFEL